MISSVNPIGLSYADIASLFGAASTSSAGAVATITKSTTIASISSVNDPAKAIQAILAQAEVAKAPAAPASTSGVSAMVENAYAAQTSLTRISGSFADPGMDTYAAVSKVDMVQASYTSAPGAATSGHAAGASMSSALSVAAQKISDDISAVTGPITLHDGKSYGIGNSTFAMSTISQGEAGTRNETASVLKGAYEGWGMVWRQEAILRAAQDVARLSEQSRYAGPAGPSPAGTSGPQPNGPQAAPSALKIWITIYNDPSLAVDGAFKLAEAQAKQLVSSYKQYLATNGPATAGTGFYFSADYGPASSIVISGSVQPDDAAQTYFSRSLDDNIGPQESYRTGGSFLISL